MLYCNSINTSILISFIKHTQYSISKLLLVHRLVMGRHPKYVIHCSIQNTTHFCQTSMYYQISVLRIVHLEYILFKFCFFFKVIFFSQFCPNTRGVCCLLILVNLALILVALGFIIVLQLPDPAFVWYLFKIKNIYINVLSMYLHLLYMYLI